MEEVAFGDWPGQPVEWNVGNNPWLPAYGMHAPSELMREDFGGNPDADYFLPGSCGGNSYAYLETILEETSDDLRSETDTDSRGSPVGWLATDSESGSVICLDQSEDCDSDREIACPAKRRKHENFLTVQIDDEEESISRSSSLLQFETLEKECQENSSPSIFSQFSFDSLESTNNRQKTNVSPDSLNSPNSEDEADFFKNITLTSNKRDNFSNSRSESSDSDTTIENSRSYDNLKTWRSFESLSLNNSNNVINNKKDDKVSAENLSEDSGYSDHLSKSSGNLERKMKNENEEVVKRNMGRTYGSRFGAYDGDGFQNFTGNFGVSYQDLTAFDKLDPQPTPAWRSSPLIDAFLRKKLAAMSTDDSPKIHQCAIFDSRSSSAPELVDRAGRNGTPEVLCRSAPEGLENLEEEENKGQSGCGERRVSVAEQDLDIGDISGISDMANYRREGSYEQAMANRVDLSDDESSLRYKKRLPKTPIIEFDRRVLKAISEQSIQSLQSSNHSLNNFNAIKDELRSPKPKRPHNNYLSTSSTPNLNKLEICPKYIDIEDKGKSVHEVNHVCQREEEKYVVPDFEVLRPKSPEDIDSNVIIRKGSIIKSSTSTSGMSDDGEKTLRNSVKSFTGSTGSKGVHFSPVVSEVNWQDNASNSTATPDRESSYSLRSSSSSPEPEKPPAPPVVLKPKPKYGSPARRTVSQPELSETDTMDEFNSNLQQLLKVDVSKSQPDVSSMRRRGSKLLKRAGDGAVLAAYVDRDGIQYKHTHLGAPTSTSTVNNAGKNPPGNTDTGPGSARATAGGTATAGTMEAEQRQKRDSRGKIGGFLQRLASFRFGGKRDKEKQKRKDGAVGSVAPQTRTHQPRIATKDDYIYIPLKGPNVTTSKPPLPRQPPRVVHASAKNGAPAQRRRTVDAAPVAMEPPAGLIETDLDTEVTVITGGNGSNGTKTRSMLSLVPGEQMEKRHRPHKSMEFLLDKQNLKVVEPPENELQKGERVMSEHQLRVQRSLQKLTVPEWYKNSPVPREGFLLKKNSARESRWTGTSNKTTSLSSLGSTNQSPLALSPTPCTQPFVRWSTSKLNSTASSPCQSTRASFNVNTNRQTSPGGSARSSFSYRQPYLGWRSQERLSRPRTPAERLASSILDGRRDDELDSKNHENQVASPEIQIGIKEVTSAIVHYVSGRRPDALDAPSRSPGSSPRGSQKLCWLESSFVGTRPPDSPQTPAGIQSSEINEDGRDQGLRLDLQTHNDIMHLSTGESHTRPSPGSTTLEDVLDSLLGLPSGRAPSPCIQAGTASVSVRRDSEELEVSVGSPPVVRCRYPRCGKSALLVSTEASVFKNCHNCAYTYCSRACRRAHWERHRKTCLFSRVGSLCRQVIASAKEQKDALLHLSKIARRGYISHGLGAVKCFFPTPEAAERFLADGAGHLGELTYVRWQDLLPSEMGPQLYAELVRMCKGYNPDTRLVLYVSVCVVSEVPESGAVKWERQLVSRCAKLRLSKEVYNLSESNQGENLETLVLTCLPLPDSLKSEEIRRAIVDNCQNQLRERGVSLRRQHPLVFKQLNAYCEDLSLRLNAITLYPKDANTGKSFMCIIMLESDLECVKKVEMAGVKVRTIDLLEK